MTKKGNKRNKEENKYNAENEIIIGVTTKPKENVRVDKKTTRTNQKNIKKKQKKSKSVKVSNKNLLKEQIIKEKQIKKINRKKILISVLGALAIAISGTIYYLTTPVFNIAHIQVYGNEKNSVDTYISLSGININETNIFGFTKISIQNRIKEDSYVEKVEIKRKLPNILELHIIERKVSYQVENLNSYILLDSQGYILEISEDKRDVPIINGFDTINGNIKIGERLIEEDLIKLNTVVKIINYCKYNVIENKITHLDVGEDSNYILKFEEDKKIVYLGDASNISERLSLLKTILTNEEEKEIEIFMNGDLSQDDVYIRYIKDKND